MNFYQKIITTFLSFVTVFLLYGNVAPAHAQEAAHNQAAQDTAGWRSNGQIITLDQVKDSLEQYQKNNNQLGLARSYHKLADLHRQKKDPSSAIAHYLVAGLKYKQVGKTGRAVEIYHNVARLYREQNDYLKALEYARQAREMASEIKNDSLVAMSAFRLGRIYKEMGHHEEAEESFQVALELFKRYEHTEILSDMYHHMAELQEEQGQVNESMDMHQQALDIRKDVNDSSGLADTYSQLGQLFATKDDVSLAVDHYRQAADINHKLNNPVEAAQNYIQIGKIHAAKEDHRQVLEYVNQAMSIANQYDALELKVEAMKLAAGTHIRLGNIEKGLNLRDQLDELQDSLEQLKQKQQRQSVLMQLRTQEKIDSLEQLQLVHEQQKAQLEREHFLLLITVVAAVFLVIILVLLYNRYQYRREQESVLLEKNKKLEDLNKRLKSLNEEKNEILQTVTHDMKNPLSGIIGLANLAVTEPDSVSRDELLDFMDQIEQTALDMNNMVTRLLDVHAIESGDHDLQLEPQDASNVLQEVIQGNKARAEEKGLDVVSPDSLKKTMVLGDRTALKRVLDNLLSNAIKYSPPNKKISLGLQSVNGHVRIEVKDQGPGIKPEETPRLFSKFGRLSSEPTGGEHSTGLGLYIARQLVEEMQGQIGCDSKPGEGATFYVNLKRVQTDGSNA